MSENIQINEINLRIHEICRRLAKARIAYSIAVKNYDEASERHNATEQRAFSLEYTGLGSVEVIHEAFEQLASATVHWVTSNAEVTRTKRREDDAEVELLRARNAYTDELAQRTEGEW